MSELAKLIARRLCHDLSGPAGAIASVVEMMADGTDAELLALLADSSRTLVATLRLYRFIHNNDAAGDWQACLAEWVATREGVTLAWGNVEGVAGDRAALLLGLALTALEAAPGDAVLTVDTTGVGVTAARLMFDAWVGATLEGGPPATPRTSLAAMLHDAAVDQGQNIRVEATTTALALTLYQGSALPR